MPERADVFHLHEIPRNGLEVPLWEAGNSIWSLPIAGGWRRTRKLTQYQTPCRLL